MASTSEMQEPQKAGNATETAAKDPTRCCWISIGSNIDREASIQAAVQALEATYGHLVLSPIYETQAVGFEGDAFYNLVVGIQTEASVEEINVQLRAIEDANGRQRGRERFSSRTLDLDLLTWGEAVGVIDGCRLPRAEILEQAFVLGPLADVAPSDIHPAAGQSYGALWGAMAAGAPEMRRVNIPILRRMPHSQAP